MPAVQIQSAAGQHSGGTTTTTLSTSIAAGTTPVMIAAAPLDENFTRRLIDAVKAQPCLYNPNHEHYGNKHSSAQYRIQVWQKLRCELGYKDDAHALQMQWKRIRDRYVRERRKRRNASSGENSQDSSTGGRERHASGGSNCSTSSNATNTSPTSRQFTEMMRWIEPFLIDNMTNNSLHSLSVAVTSSASNAQQQYSQQLTASQQSNSSIGQNGGAVAVIASTAVTDAGTYYVHQNQILNKEEIAHREASINSADRVAVSSYQQTSKPQLISTRTSHEYNMAHGHGLSNVANGNRNTSVVSTSATGFTFTENLYNGSPCSSTTSSEIDVGTSTTTTSYSGQQQQVILQQQPQQQRQRQSLSQQPSSMVVLTAVQSQQTTSVQQSPVLLPKTDQRPRIGQQLQTADGGVVTVTARGMAPVTGVIKKDVNVRTNDGSTVTMIIDPTTFYQHGSQKMYRLVNVSELSADAVSVSASNSVPTVSGEVKIVGIPQRRKRVAALSVQGMPNGRGQLGDDVVLDDGISEKTVTIDQGTITGNERIVLDQRPANAVPGRSVMLSHNVQQMHQQLPSSSQAHQSISVSSHPVTISTPHAAQIGLQQISTVPLRQQHQQTGQHRFVTQAVSVEHPHYAVLPSQSLQEEHDANLAFANSIADHLSRLNEDEKAVAKMNIQRILMDARFGMGASARMIHDEELNEAAAAVNSSSHEQHVDGTSRRMT